MTLQENDFSDYSYLMLYPILDKNQEILLGVLGKNTFLTQHFYLTGGTALAAFYLGHRYSEDLDFFSEQEFDVLPLDVLFESLREKFHISKIDYQQSFNRNLFFLSVGKDIVKLEFTYFPFPRIEKEKEEYGIQIDSLLDIAVNKLFSIYQRNQARDYIDLYLICREKGFSIQDLTQKARQKFDWHIDLLQLGTQFIKAQEAVQYPRMISILKPEDWQRFFVEEAKKLKEKII